MPKFLKYLPAESFDLVVSSMVLLYLDEKQLKKTLQNFYTWLKGGGMLFYLTTHPFKTNKIVTDYQIRGWREILAPWGDMITVFHRTVSDFINETLSAGFILEIVDEPAFMPEAKSANPKEYQRYQL